MDYSSGSTSILDHVHSSIRDGALAALGGWYSNTSRGPYLIQSALTNETTGGSMDWNVTYGDLLMNTANTFFLQIRDVTNSANNFNSSTLNFTSSITTSSSTFLTPSATTITQSGSATTITVGLTSSSSFVTSTTTSSVFSPTPTSTISTPTSTPTTTPFVAPPAALPPAAQAGISIGVLSVLMFIIGFGYYIRTHKNKPFSQLTRPHGLFRFLSLFEKLPPPPVPSSPPPPVFGPAELPGSHWSQRRWGGIPGYALEMDEQRICGEMETNANVNELHGEANIGELETKGNIGEMDAREIKGRWENYKGKMVAMSGIFELSADKEESVSSGSTFVDEDDIGEQRMEGGFF